MPAEIHGELYYTVAERLKSFRDDHQDYVLMTEIIINDDVKVVMKASILDANKNLIANGYAEEIRGASKINQVSALENAETSAVGRALAFFKYGGQHVRSAEEMQSAIDQQEILDAQKRGIQIGKAQQQYSESIENIQDLLADGDYLAAYEAWENIPQQDKGLLWIAPTKGGCFTTKERKQMQSSEWTEARTLFHQQKDKEEGRNND